MGSVAGPTGKIDRRSGWKTLEPDRVLPRWEWPDRPTLEIVTGGKGNPRGFARNFGHAWLRLVDVDGSVCSVGFFPDESGAISPDLQPGLRMPGMLLHPDKYDGLRYPTRTTSIRLNADRFHAVRRHIEQLQADRANGALAFGLVDRSCVWFLADVAAVAGVQIDATYDLISAAADQLPASIQRRVATSRRKDVQDHRRQEGSLVRRLATLVSGTVFNAGLAILGGRRVERTEWTRDPDGSVGARSIAELRPVFSGWRAVVGPAVPFYHVRALIEWQIGVGPELTPDADPPDRT